jgi:hypothetical protein
LYLEIGGIGEPASVGERVCGLGESGGSVYFKNKSYDGQPYGYGSSVGCLVSGPYANPATSAIGSTAT